MRRIRVYFLGGTISMTAPPHSSADSVASPGLAPTLVGPDLLGALDLPGDVVVDPVDVTQVDSSALTFTTCLQTLALADEAVESAEADGVVVVQGTDTLEETAYLWDLVWRHSAPFVVTGAMRAPESPGADGPANLLAAVSVAASPDCADQGALVVIGDEIHAARYVAKRHASSPAAFVSPGFGPVGQMQEAAPLLSARVPRRAVLAVPTHHRQVALVRAAIGDDARVYRAAADLADALVVDGFGAGQVRPEVAEVLLDVARDKPVVLASRTGAGAVATSTYGGRGSGTDLVAGGVVPAGRLSALKARVLLFVLVSGAEPASRADVAEAFAYHG